MNQRRIPDSEASDAEVEERGGSEALTEGVNVAECISSGSSGFALVAGGGAGAGDARPSFGGGTGASARAGDLFFSERRLDASDNELSSSSSSSSPYIARGIVGRAFGGRGEAFGWAASSNAPVEDGAGVLAGIGFRLVHLSVATGCVSPAPNQLLHWNSYTMRACGSAIERPFRKCSPLLTWDASVIFMSCPTAGDSLCDLSAARY